MNENWPRCPEAANWFEQQLQQFTAQNPRLQEMQRRFLTRAGVRMENLVDHWLLPDSPSLRRQLELFGMTPISKASETVWKHMGARLPRVRLQANAIERLALQVENTDMFLKINQLDARERQGEPGSSYYQALCTLPYGELAVLTRCGTDGFTPEALSQKEAERIRQASQLLRSRARSGSEAEALKAAASAVAQAIELIGQNRTVHEFFAVERDYYMSRNTAARRQYAWQQSLGLGWANHDHHTYRCSRSQFRTILALWLSMGFEIREKFYAGAEAGWGAQVLEHPVCRIIIFCDVDMAPEELDINYAENSLPDTPDPETIGLWCALHGDSIGRAGMHHLEAEFDFEQCEALHTAAGQKVMAPFTSLPMLKQAFTAAELWPVEPARAEVLVNKGVLTPEQAQRFIQQGAAGSHLEILQRWEGFKGFNQTGVSAIIRATDARILAAGEN